MISAGQMVPQQQYPQQYGQYGNQYGSQYGSQYGGGSMYGSQYGASMAPQMGQAPQLAPVNYQMQQMPSTGGGMSISVGNDSVSEDTIKQLAKDQKDLTKSAVTWTAVGNCVGAAASMLQTGLQAWLNGKYLDNQSKMIEGHYKLQSKIVEGQTTVALKQYDVQEKAISAQKSMHQVQVTHEEKMAKITGNVQVKLAAMDQSGRTERLKIMAVTDPFSNRGQYDSGLPAFPC